MPADGGPGCLACTPFDGQYIVMTDVFVEWATGMGPSESDMEEFVRDSNRCRNLHKVQFQESLLDDEGRRLICHFRAPDAESVRMALRCIGADIDFVWAGTIHEAKEPTIANVVVEHKLSHSNLSDTIETIDAIAAEWADSYGFRLTRAIVSLDGARLLCFYKAPDAESISLAQSQNSSRTTTIWACRRFTSQVHQP